MIVATFTGAWIEIYDSGIYEALRLRSHPSRVRGLKCKREQQTDFISLVAPFTGAWIEIHQRA